MARAARWTCPGCREVLGGVDRRGTLVVHGARVVVRRGPTVVVVCPGCHAEREWRDARELRPTG